MRHTLSSRTLPKDRDVVRIATKGGNVILDPLQCHDLVQRADIRVGEVWVREVSEDPEAVLDRDLPNKCNHKQSVRKGLNHKQRQIIRLN